MRDPRSSWSCNWTWKKKKGRTREKNAWSEPRDLVLTRRNALWLTTGERRKSPGTAIGRDRNVTPRSLLRHAFIKLQIRDAPRKKINEKKTKKKSNTRPSFEVKFDACSMIKETYYARGCNFCNLISCRFLRTNPVPSPPSSSPFYPPFFFINSYD